MPLLDHFHPPLSGRRHWEAFLTTWVNILAQQLNGDLLPAGFFALPNVFLGSQLQRDVGTLEEVWGPPGWAVPVAFTNPDLFEVQVIHDEGGLRLVAAIELFSPANKDRPANRRAFAVKCASYLQQRIAVIVVDVVTTRQANVHLELLRILEAASAGQEDVPSLCAAGYRTRMARDQVFLEAWPAPLTLGSSLPTLPLWLDPELALPLDLEKSYTSACASLRIRA